MPLFWTGCNAIMDKGSLMSPAKMFAYMKERESKAEQQEGRNHGTRARDLFGRKCVTMWKSCKKSTTHRDCTKLVVFHFLYFPQVIVFNPEMCRPQQSTLLMKTSTLQMLRKVWLLAVNRARSQLTVSQTQIPQKTSWSPLCHRNLSYSKTRSSSIHRGSPYQRNTRLCTSLRTGHCPLISRVWVEIDFQNEYVLEQNGDSNMVLTEHGIHSLIKCLKGLQEVVIFCFDFCCCCSTLAGECDLSEKMVPEEESSGPVCWWNPQVSVY